LSNPDLGGDRDAEANGEDKRRRDNGPWTIAEVRGEGESGNWENRKLKSKAEKLKN